MNAPILPGQPDGFGSDRHWSLWEMLKFNAQSFYEVTTSMQHTQSLLEEHGKDKHKETEDGGLLIEHISDPVMIRLMTKRVKKLEDGLRTLGTSQTLKTVRRLLDELEDNPTYPEFVRHTREIRSRLQDELEDVVLLALEPGERAYFEPQEPLFGVEFACKFVQGGVYELDEAAKCLALGRSTATVFHLMRLMEIGIEAMRLCLGISPPVKPVDRNWGNLLKVFRDVLNAKWPTPAHRMQGDGALFDSLYTSLDAVKNPWRNATMHVENKYTDDEAEHIFMAVRGFMKKLASRMDEGGNPKA